MITENILNEFFNNNSDANKYLTAEKQEDLENDFFEFLKSYKFKIGVKDMFGKEIKIGDTLRYSKWNTKNGFSPMGSDSWKEGIVYFQKGKCLVSGDEEHDTLNYKNIKIV